MPPGGGGGPLAAPISVAGMQKPLLDPSVWVAPGAVVVGDVVVGRDTSIWYTAVVRGDGDPIRIGAASNIQDGAVLHSDPGIGIEIGDGVSVGHRAVLHGCVVEDDVLIGMGAIVMNRARIGTGSIVAAGALVPEGREIPAGSLVKGAPAAVSRAVSEHELFVVRYAAEHYVGLAAQHRQELTP